MEIVLSKGPQDSWLSYVDGEGPFTITIARGTKAGEAVRLVQAFNPEAKVGVRSKDIGPATQIAYGEVVWFKKLEGPSRTSLH